MADTVRRALEEMVPELEDLEKRGYFSKNEIKQIVQKRQDFEYNLRRRAALKSDFIRYIDYENSLERLRQLRKKQRGIVGATSLADHCIVRRTHFIYERATRKFKGDLALWSRWLKYCQHTKSTRQMSRVLTRALQLHPTCAALWTYAAAWEFEHNANAVAARALMQRGLRMCKEAHSLWHEYFRMELLYAARLVARRQVLGLTIDGGDAGNGIAEENSDASAAAAAAAVLKGAVAKVVYSNAVETVSDSLSFRSGFLDVLRDVVLPGKDELESFILNDIETAFGSTPEAVALQAQRKMTDLMGKEAAGELPCWPAVEAALKIFHSGLKESPSEALFDEALGFVEGLVQRALGANSSANASCTQALVEECIKVIKIALESDLASESAQLTLPRIYLRLGKLKEAFEAANTSTATSVAIVHQRLGLQAAAASLQVAPSASPAGPQELAAVVQNTEDGRQVEIWCAAIRSAVASGKSLDEFAKLLIEQQSGSAKGPVRGGMGGPAAALFSAIWATSGPKSARKFYKALLSRPLPGAEVVHAILDAELALMTAKDPGAVPLPRMREIFEAGVAAYGNADEELWVRYLQFEQRQENGKNAGAIHWRAVKALDDADAFVARIGTQLY